MALLSDAALTFEGPSATLFALGSWIVSVHFQNLEAHCPTSDFIEFLIYIAETPNPSLFTGPEGPTGFLVDEGLLYIHGLEDSETLLPLADFEAFLEFLTELLERSGTTLEEELSLLGTGWEFEG
jgi:hypothetical protein